MALMMINLGKSDDKKNNNNDNKNNHNKDGTCKTFNQASSDIEKKLARHSCLFSLAPSHTDYTLAIISKTLRILAVFLWRWVNKKNVCIIFCCSHTYNVRIFSVFRTSVNGALFPILPTKLITAWNIFFIAWKHWNAVVQLFCTLILCSQL